MSLHGDRLDMAAPARAPSTKIESIEAIASYFDRLFPILRSLTGAGLRETHAILGELLPLDHTEVPSGTRVFDWTVPQEWIVRDAYLVTPEGERILDVHDNNLHLVNYSVPFRGTVSRESLEAHLHSKPALPDAVPYITSYYAPRWGFCLSEKQRRALPAGDYQVVIDTDHVDGSMTISEAVLPGRESAEVLLTSYTCHPSLANDELSGPLVLAFLAQRIARWPDRRLTYRFVLHPETIGAIAYLKLRGEHLKRRTVAGYVVSNVGVDAAFRYKRSRRGDTPGDRAAISVLRSRPGPAPVIADFEPLGSDERQYCSPGFDLPIGVISRTPNSYREYHTSLDNRDFISFEALSESVDVYEAVCRTLDRGDFEGEAEPAVGPRADGDGPRYRNLSPFGEPQLGRRGLYPTLGHTEAPAERIKAILWVLNLSDGDHGLQSIAARSGLPLAELSAAADACVEAGLLEPLR